MNTPDIVVVEPRSGESALLEALSILRMTVFRSWPYLYDGTKEYELAYLAEFLNDPTAVLVIAQVGDIPIGMATASPLATQSDRLTAPFVAAEMDVDSFYYFGDSVLLPQFRGMGIGHQFFDKREERARAAGVANCTFCAVERNPDHPKRPPGERDLAPFWQKRGYRKAPDIHVDMAWKEIATAGETNHHMSFWTKSYTELETRSVA